MSAEPLAASPTVCGRCPHPPHREHCVASRADGQECGCSEFLAPPASLATPPADVLAHRTDVGLGYWTARALLQRVTRYTLNHATNGELLAMASVGEWHETLWVCADAFAAFVLAHPVPGDEPTLDSPNSLGEELAALRERGNVRVHDPRPSSGPPSLGAATPPESCWYCPHADHTGMCAECERQWREGRRQGEPTPRDKEWFNRLMAGESPFSKLLTDATNATFDCGEWAKADNADEPPAEPYADVLARSHTASATALAYVTALESALAARADEYPAAARVIHLHLTEFCDESLPYPTMIADAARKAAAALTLARQRADASEQAVAAAELVVGHSTGAGHGDLSLVPTDIVDALAKALAALRASDPRGSDHE